MTYKIAPYEKTGSGELNAAGTTELVAENAKAFRNVAVGATLKVNGGTYTVTAKTDEEHLNVNATLTFSNKTWTYKNPDLELSGIYYVKHNKNDKPTMSPISLKDSDGTWASTGQGVVREINISGWIRSTSLADVYKNATILESLADGTQGRYGTCVYTEEVPPRSSYVWITSLNWQFGRDKPKWLDVIVNMVECKNRGSL
jgi:hypothetical protein